MTLILRKCKADGSSSHSFTYGNAGDTVTAPVWSSEPQCGDGLHGLKNGNGNWHLLNGHDWIVIEAADVVDIDKQKCKFRTGTIIYRGAKEGLHQYAHLMATESKSAYHWAREIGNKEVMIDRITESHMLLIWNSKKFDNKMEIVNDTYSS